MKVVTFYTLLPFACHVVALAALYSSNVFFPGLGAAAFVLGGVVLVPCVVLYILVALVRRNKLRAASKTRLFFSGLCNPVPVLFVLWVAFWVGILGSHA